MADITIRELDSLNRGVYPSISINGVKYPVEIISGEVIPITNTYKSVVHKMIGDQDRYEYVGKGEEKVVVKFYQESREDYQRFVKFLEGGEYLSLNCDFYLSQKRLSVLGNIDLETYYKGYGVAKVTFTTAKNINQNLRSREQFKTAETSISEQTQKGFLNSLRNFGQEAFNFTNNASEKIGSITNSISVYSSAIQNVTQGLASTTTLITNPISSIQSSASRVIGGVSGFVSKLQNTVSIIKQTPDNLSDAIDTFLLIGDQLNNLFDLGDSNQNNKYNTEILETTALGIINAQVNQDNENIDVAKPNTDTINKASTAAEFFLTSVKNDNQDILDILLLSSLLFSIYENVNNATDWNKSDLDAIKEKTETIYNYIIGKDVITPDVKLSLDIARNRFFRFFIDNYDNANSTVVIKITTPRSLSDVVYSVNGNLDFYFETKKLNNILGEFVYDDIEVIRNE